MNILLMGTATDFKNDERGNLAGFNHAFTRAFQELGHTVFSYKHRDPVEAMQIPPRIDLFILRDVTVDPRRVAILAERSDYFAMFTHAEFIQGRTMDRAFFERLENMGCTPDHLFYDQAWAYKRYDELGIDIPGTFLGWGANLACYCSAEKDIDILWLGHAYSPRQGLVEKYIYPLKDSGLNVRIHGRGQPDGPVNMVKMFDLLAKTKVVVRISHKAHWEGGYSGRTIYDAFASGCGVVHDTYPMCYEMFPLGVKFVKPEETGETALEMAGYENIVELGDYSRQWVLKNRMVSHVAQDMIDFTMGRRKYERFHTHQPIRSE